MDAAATWEPMGAGAGSLEEDLLLCEALAIIGDLDCDLDDPLMESLRQNDAQAVVSTTDQPLATDHTCKATESLRLPRNNGQETITSPLQAEWPQILPSSSDLKAGRPKRRRREELLYLRGLVTELEDRLTMLRKPEEPPCEQETRGETDALAVAMWENVAQHQRAQRHESEMENIKLRRLLQDQIQVGKSLERLLLRKRPKLEGVETMAPHAKRLNRSNSRTWNRAQVFDELVASCADLYAATARILSQFDLRVQASVPRKVELVHDPEDGLIVRTTEQRIVPFHYEEVAHQMWEMFPQSSVFIEDIDNRCDDVSELQFRIVPQAHNLSSGDFLVNLVKHRFVEANRVVIIYAASFKSSEISMMKMDGISMRHKAWNVIEPLENNPSRGSRITEYHSSSPELVGEIPDQERKVGALTNFLLSAIAVELEAHHVLLENRLIERSLQSGG